MEESSIKGSGGNKEEKTESDSGKDLERGITQKKRKEKKGRVRLCRKSFKLERCSRRHEKRNPI